MQHHFLINGLFILPSVLGCSVGERVQGLWHDGKWMEVQIMEIRQDIGYCGVYRVNWWHTAVCDSSSTDYWGDDPKSANRFCLLGREKLRGGSCNSIPCQQVEKQDPFSAEVEEEEESDWESPVIMGLVGVVVGGTILACVCGLCRMLFLDKVGPEDCSQDVESGSPKSPSKRRTMLWSPPKRSPSRRKLSPWKLNHSGCSSVDESFSHSISPSKDSFPVVQDLSLEKYRGHRPSFARKSSNQPQMFKPLSSRNGSHFRPDKHDGLDREVPFSYRRSCYLKQGVEERRQEQIEAAQVAQDYQQYLSQLREAGQSFTSDSLQNDFSHIDLPRPRRSQSGKHRTEDGRRARHVSGPRTLTRTTSHPKLSRLPV